MQQQACSTVYCEDDCYCSLEEEKCSFIKMYVMNSLIDSAHRRRSGGVSSGGQRGEGRPLEGSEGGQGSKGSEGGELEGLKLIKFNEYVRACL